MMASSLLLLSRGLVEIYHISCGGLLLAAIDQSYWCFEKHEINIAASNGLLVLKYETNIMVDC